MTRVTFEIPVDLLEQIEVEASRRNIGVGAFLETAVEHEIEGAKIMRAKVIKDLDELSTHWSGPTDAVTLIRNERASH